MKITSETIKSFIKEHPNFPNDAKKHNGYYEVPFGKGKVIMNENLFKKYQQVVRDSWRNNLTKKL